MREARAVTAPGHAVFDVVPATKVYHRGTHRLLPPVETIARVRPLMREMGITRVANVTGLDRIGLPVMMVCRPNARSIAVSQGKGLDPDAAKASGLMEAAELYHAEHIDRPIKLESSEDLSRHHHVIDVATLPHLAESRFHRRRTLLWIEGRELVADLPIWLPFELVHANYTLPLPTGIGCFSASTNGLASGNHVLEAISHGICEVIERDATSLWHQLDKSRRDLTRVELATIEDDVCQDVLARLERAGLKVALWNTTTDIGVPAFYCVIDEPHGDAGHAGVGAGCHPVREIAVLRALTEAVQVRMTYITGARDDLPATQFTRSGRLDKRRAAHALTWDQTPVLDFRAILDHPAATFQDDVAWLLGRLRVAGIGEVVAVDLSKPEFGLAVVRIVVPGLESPHDDDGYLPGQRARAMREGRL